MRIVFIGSVMFSRTVLDTLSSMPDVTIAGIVTRRESPHSSDFVSLRSDADALAVPCLEADDVDAAALTSWIGAHEPDAIFCIGWNRLLGSDVLAIPPRGVIGYHPAALPANRGRHPIIWALVLGLSETASTFFRMDTGADTGPIIDQEPVPIDDDDDAGTLYARLQKLAPRQLHRFVPRLTDGTLNPQAQDPASGNSWRKRTSDDGRIDWRMPAENIRNLVRALRPPYPGATCRNGTAESIVWQVETVAGVAENLEPGKILEASPTGIVIKCGLGALRIIEHTFDPLPETGSYL
jgi:methionyl-tRNA formyltransferase